MITLTDGAILQVRKLQADKAKAGQLLRIFVEAGGCSGFEYGMSFDCKKAGDRLLENNGVSFLVDASSLEYLDGSVIHFDDGLNGKGFDIQNPNASSTCGSNASSTCGTGSAGSAKTPEQPRSTRTPESRRRNRTSDFR